MDIESYELWVCVDCLMFIANGDVPEDDVDGWNPDDLEREWPDFNLCAGHGKEEEEEEAHFSWADCDACGSSLGGDRHPATAYRTRP